MVDLTLGATKMNTTFEGKLVSFNKKDEICLWNKTDFQSRRKPLPIDVEVEAGVRLRSGSGGGGEEALISKPCKVTSWQRGVINRIE